MYINEILDIIEAVIDCSETSENFSWIEETKKNKKTTYV